MREAFTERSHKGYFTITLPTFLWQLYDNIKHAEESVIGVEDFLKTGTVAVKWSPKYSTAYKVIVDCLSSSVKMSHLLTHSGQCAWNR